MRSLWHSNHCEWLRPVPSPLPLSRRRGDVVRRGVVAQNARRVYPRLDAQLRARGLSRCSLLPSGEGAPQGRMRVR
ncbi:hypothetical protein EIQ23_16720, partial [Xanthomonas campestris pv. campestris]